MPSVPPFEESVIIEPGIPPSGTGAFGEAYSLEQATYVETPLCESAQARTR